ncbi:MAG TPA: hypothetical protein DEP48_03975 [Persephonella sp.]|uniref:Uncharacterized protein n=1 Tax=Persephonella marina (strain DSM 14350 / EX-H1) TaxID=123214 RepID=C0QQF6_PERMH|nr:MULTISPECIES: hypothetical protein [Persephonella]ACO04121.1 hypothetical protein PERMA_1116 [Persephonella marina EX-H1]HCB69492.1 hypothetical protein [Persephonella sp.]
MITKILWETFSVALLLYGLYLVYVFIWFSTFRITETDIQTSKLIAGSVIGIILIVSSYRWFKKKREELKALKEEEG